MVAPLGRQKLSTDGWGEVAKKLDEGFPHWNIASGNTLVVGIQYYHGHRSIYVTQDYDELLNV